MAGAAPIEVSHGRLLRIAVPMTLGYLTTPLVGIVAIGAVGTLGVPALTAGVALGSVVTDVVLATCSFLRSGTTGLTAQATGRGDRAEQVAVACRALLLAVGIGLVLVAALPLVLAAAPLILSPSAEAGTAMADYLTVRLLGAPLTLANFVLFGWLLGQGRAGLALAIQTVLNGANIALALLLVGRFGVAGAAGAAVVADGLAFAVGAGIVLPVLRAGGLPSRARLLDAAALKAMLAMNRDILIRTFALLAAFTFFAREGARQGDVILSANAILEKFFLVGGYLLDGVAAAAETFAGLTVGARDRAGFGRAVRLCVLWGGGLSVVVSAGLMTAGPWLMAAMTPLASVRETAALYLPWAALTPMAGVLAFLMDGIYIGATWSRDMRNMMLASLALAGLAWGVLMPPFGNHGLWAALLVLLGARGLSLAALLPGRIRATFSPPSAP